MIRSRLTLLALLVAVLVAPAIASTALASATAPASTAIASGPRGVRPETRVRAFALGSGARFDGDRDAAHERAWEIGDALRWKASGCLLAARGPAAFAPRALPAARQIEAAWGASTYRHGGLMTGMEHIMYRHSASSGFANVSRFAEDTTARNIAGYVDEAIRYGTVMRTGPAAFTVEQIDLKPTLDRIASGGRFPHRNDGAIFQNRPLPGRTTPELPAQSPGYYREYVHPTPGVSGPGPQRVVVGQGGEMYYTPDHYQTFIPVQ